MSDEVSNFLRSVEQLKDRRLEEDEARARELEERILQEKRERQARRAERARSISPQKSSPAQTPSPAPNPQRYNNDNSSSSNPSSPPARSSNNGASSLTKENESPIDGDAKSSSGLGLGLGSSFSGLSAGSAGGASGGGAGQESPLARTPTLSWQQRRTNQPPSPDRSSRRPLSVYAAENAAVRSSESKDTDESPISRDKIAQTLSGKDPAWFRQTADRGLNSAAYRRSQVEDEDRQDLTAASSRLPGMSREPSAEPSSGPSAESSNALAVAAASVRSPAPAALTPVHKLDPPVSRDIIASPPSPTASSRTSPTRPLSPTKGAGGFVQSAMMKRSDSVKRWSVASPPGLHRTEVGRRPTITSQAGPPARPTSSHGQDPASDVRPATPTHAPEDQDERTTAATATATAAATAPAAPAAEEDDKKAMEPASPSKTLDSRRWSPTKIPSSWLDAALNKPDSPKPKTFAAPNSQPAWMQELNKNKGHRSTPSDVGPTTSNMPMADAARAAPVPARKHEVKTGGLLRSSAMPIGAAVPPPATIAGRSATISYHAPSASISSIRHDRGMSVSEARPDELPQLPQLPPQLQPKPRTDLKETQSISDFRSTLKPRQPLPEKKDDSGNEVKAVFGTLRRTKTQNFVAPDVLKDNILRGKSALAVTGGPKPREKKDELKDAILQKKAEFSQAKTEGRGIATNAHAQGQSQNVPEGLVKRLELSKTGGSLRRDSSPTKPTLDVFRREPMIERRDSSPTKPTSDVFRREPSPMKPTPTVDAHREPSPVKAIGSKLADRFNPALAGLLVRGPPPMATTSAADTSAGSSAGTSSTEAPSGPGPQLTHMTKGRARGPRRKAPSNLQAKTETAPAASPSPLATPRKVSESTKKAPKPSPKPESLSRSGSWKPIEDDPVESTPSKRVVSPLPPKTSPTFKAPAGTASPRKIDVKRMSRFLEETANRPSVSAPVEVPRPLSPQKTGGAGARPLPDPRALSPHKTGGSARPLPVAPGSAGSAYPAPLRSPSRNAHEVSAVLRDFFGSERPGRRLPADAASVLSQRPAAERPVRTVDAQLFRVGSDGRKQTVSEHLARTLFEGEMYLCPHTFTAGSSSSTEVYFWVGDDVPLSIADDVHVVLENEARALGGPLVRLRQGRETAEFVAALGGVVTVRRGMSHTFDGLAAAMLCGRRYMGQVVFDEVECHPSSLCSGFPFLIARQGRCHLWKGKGSSVDEVSCARLLGMDMAVVGELAEVDEGRESANFWAVFGDAAGTSGAGNRPGSADHWRLKPRYERYAGRLFRSDAGPRDQVVEVRPFDQRDLSPDGIYVLDAFFELYVIVGRESQDQYAAFHNALEFAQEYAVLVAGAEDRPFVPTTSVVLEGIPRDLKSVFRKWTDAASPTRLTGAPAEGGIKRGRSLRIVPLNVALQALQS